jgi:enoyl-CoA hydratase
MSEQAVRVEKSGPVSTVFLHRPARRNAVDGPTAARLADAFRAFDADPEASVAVLHGEGGVFCSGADLTAIGTGRGNRVAADGDGPMGVSRLRLAKPVIAAVAGYAVAGGLELALWCDLRVADETAVFGVFCRRWGVPLVDGGTVRLPRLIGTSRAMDMILTGRAVDAAEAAAIGLANRVVPAGPGPGRGAGAGGRAGRVPAGVPAQRPGVGAGRRRARRDRRDGRGVRARAGCPDPGGRPGCRPVRGGRGTSRDLRPGRRAIAQC